MLNYLEFKNILKYNNINLFDSQYRIAYSRLNNLNREQVGGSINNKINNLDNLMLVKLVDSLLSKNINASKWILQNY